MVLDPEREVFPYPFVRRVDAFVHFDSKLNDADHDAILRSVLDAGYNVGLPSSGDEGADGELFSAQHRADLAIVGEEVLYISTAQYVRWERFRDIVNALLAQTIKGRGIDHASVVFLDEIRPPSSTELLDWSKYANLPVVTRDIVLDHVSGSYGGLVLHLGDSKHITIEWAHTYEPAIAVDHPLHEYYEEPEDSVFAIEWAGSCRFEDPASAEDALNGLNSLHASIKEAFLQVLTPASLDLMRGET